MSVPAVMGLIELSRHATQNLLTTPAGLTLAIACPIAVALLVWGLQGTATGSPGYRLARIRLVDAASGNSVGIGRAVWRMFLGSVIPFSLFSVFFARGGQAWHDALTRTVVVDVSALGEPFTAVGVGADGLAQARGEDAPAAADDEAVAHVEDVVAPVEAVDDIELTVWKDPTIPVAQLKWDDGSVSVIDGPAHVGRNPEPEDGRDSIPVADTTRSLSRSHIAVQPDFGSILVTDLGSTNGTDVIFADGDVVRLEPFRPARVRSGDVLRFADRSCTVTLL